MGQLRPRQQGQRDLAQAAAAKARTPLVIGGGRVQAQPHITPLGQQGIERGGGESRHAGR